MSLANPTYNGLAQAAHAFAAYSIVLTAAYKFGYRVMIVIALLLVAFAIVKEFWFDLKYERPEVSGGWSGGVEDFSFYVIGVCVALLMVSL